MPLDPVVQVPSYRDENAQALLQLCQAITWGQVILTSELADSIARLNGACAELVRRKREAELPDLPPNDPRFA
jgi:hypothetical protein